MPEGGKKDVTPPVLTSAEPENSSVNFTGKKIVLTFDEFIQLTDLPGQLVVSPLMEPSPRINAYKNKITIELPDTLLPATTYSFNFGKAVVDVHESNVLDGFRYVFSTGSTIDSFSVSGKVSEAATAKPFKDITVMLYRTSNPKDSLVLKRKPDYFSRTDESGMYSINNLATGQYVLVALDDKNGNYRYDDPTEEALAFTNEAVVIPPTITLDLAMSNSLPAELRLKRSTRIRKTCVQLVFNRPVDTLEIKQPDGKKFGGIKYWSTRRDTLCLFTKDTLQDSLIVYLKGDHGLADTVAVRMIVGKPALDATGKAMLMNVSSTPSAIGPEGDFTVTSLNPLAKAEKISVFEDSVLVKGIKSGIDNSDKRKLTITYVWKPGKVYRIQVLPGEIKDEYGYSNDTLEWKFRMPDERSSGELLVTVNGKREQGEDYFLQLCSDDFKVLRQEKVTKQMIGFNYIFPGNYRLRLLKDLNHNGLWDESDYAIRKQAEPITATDAFQVRASWTMEKDITIP